MAKLSVARRTVISELLSIADMVPEARRICLARIANIIGKESLWKLSDDEINRTFSRLDQLDQAKGYGDLVEKATASVLQRANVCEAQAPNQSREEPQPKDPRKE